MRVLAVNPNNINSLADENKQLRQVVNELQERVNSLEAKVEQLKNESGEVEKLR
jgi:ubiquinone biosynthesis protein UbiJ